MSIKFIRSRKVLLVSATLSDTPQSFNIFGYVLGLYNNMRNANGWIKGMIREDLCYIGSNPINSISKAIYPKKGSRVQISELGLDFPDNQISADCYKLNKTLDRFLS